MKNLLQTEFAGVKLKNPIVLASGTCGFGREYSEIFDIEKLGGIASKGLTLNPRGGNSGIRIWETPSGMMNSVGLENPGVTPFIENELDWVNNLDVVNVVNLGGHSVEDYVRGIELLNEVDLDILELNISCPNVKAGGMNFGVKTDMARDIVKTMRKVCKHKLVVKLSPNAEDIVEIAKACEAEGADGISLVNTFLALAIDIDKKKAVFDNLYAGLSGPAIKPIALRMVNQVSKAVKIPVMGLGGVTTWQDAVEFIMAGATIVQVGTASFMNPSISLDIIDGMQKYAESENLNNISDIRGII
ncbi:dihydroorotate oxidase B, catalytic subunit [Anaerosphaera aminiphila DSM 21120]|uniref:Dihydroorotate dehydrogenase n=1 Tax=Anaerosphaera aminiphila DSM 21120 TaxID=1120995 RepID=A0A1M5QV92_9FIRM|nr:dihydroorotate dehydrogenase [Anaerosphaera aminiphila]SHH17619.1 dihydroorotate oxidase B, catalytic subunit [Anaerosphaera aminiphila DSM 21120]